MPVFILSSEGEERRRAEGAEQAEISSRTALSKWVPGVTELVLEETEARRWEATWLHLSSDAHQKAEETASLPCSVSRLTVCLPLES